MNNSIISFKEKKINSKEEWQKEVFSSGQKSKHWKPGFSAEQLAEFICQKNGLTEIQQITELVLDQPVSFEEAKPEFEVRFDKYGPGREHDLFITGKIGNRTLNIGVEAKVNEPFGLTVQDAFLNSAYKKISGKPTNGTERIIQLLNLNIPKSYYIKKGSDHSELFSLRYQLLYTLESMFQRKDSENVFYIIVFKSSPEYDELKSLLNLKDLLLFLKVLGAKENMVPKGDFRNWEIVRGEKKLNVVYIER